MSGLDPIGRKEIRDLILRLKSEGKTVFMNTHILSDVEMLCNRVAVIVKGCIRYEGAIDEFRLEREREVDVVLSGVDPELAVRLEEDFAPELRGHGERIEVRIGEKRVGKLLETALAAGASVVSVTPHRMSLESIFLHAVEAGEEP